MHWKLTVWEQFLTAPENRQSSGAVWKSRWPSWSLSTWSSTERANGESNPRQYCQCLFGPTLNRLSCIYLELSDFVCLNKTDICCRRFNPSKELAFFLKTCCPACRRDRNKILKIKDFLWEALLTLHVQFLIWISFVTVNETVCTEQGQMSQLARVARTAPSIPGTRGVYSSWPASMKEPQSPRVTCGTW